MNGERIALSIASMVSLAPSEVSCRIVLTRRNIRLPILCLQSSTAKELGLYVKTREGGAKLACAAHKIREKAEFSRQMDSQAAAKGIAKMSKSEAKLQARLELETELYMRNVQKVSTCQLSTKSRGVFSRIRGTQCACTCLTNPSV